VFDLVCANAVRSLAELDYLWYVLPTLVCCSLQLLLVYYVCIGLDFLLEHQQRKVSTKLWEEI